MNDGFQIVLGLNPHLGNSGFYVAPDQLVGVHFRRVRRQKKQLDGIPVIGHKLTN